MPRARALVAAVPQRVWTAVAGLVLLASLGVTLVLAAGLATWQGAVGNSPSNGNAQPPGSVVTPPGCDVGVQPPLHRGHVRHGRILRVGSAELSARRFR